MRKGSSPKVTGSSVGVVIGLPERVKVEPLLGRFKAIVTQAFGVAGCPLMNDLFAVAALPHHGLGERFEGQSIVAGRLLQTQQQIDLTFEQRSEERRVGKE